MKTIASVRWLLVAGLFLLTQTARAVPTPLRVVFDPELRVLLRYAITECQQTLCVEVFKLTDQGVIQDLCRAAQRGVKVRVILCPSQKANRAAAQKLAQVGAQVRWYSRIQPEQIMHLKVGIFDGQQLIFGSANWTYWGLTLHHEAMLVIQQDNVVQTVIQRFEQDWRSSRP